MKAQVVGGLHEEVSTDPNSYQLPIFEPLKVTHLAKFVFKCKFHRWNEVWRVVLQKVCGDGRRPKAASEKPNADVELLGSDDVFI